MEPCILPCSPNWFLCSVSSGSESGLYAFGSKTDVLVYDVSLTLGRVSSTSGLGKSSESVAPPAFVGCYSGHRDKVTAVRLHPDSQQWTCCSSDDYSVNLWDIRSLVSMQVHNEHKEKITSMTWSASNLDLILTSDEKGTVVMWRIKSNSVQSFRLEREYIYSLEMSPHSSSRLAIGYRSGVALIVGLDRDNPQILQRLRGHEGEILSMRWCPAEGVCTLRGDEVDMESLIATADKRCIKVWSTSNGKELMYRKISQNSSYRHDPQEPGGRRAWLSLHWPKYQPFELVFSSQSGDLLLWDLKGKPSQEPDRLIARDMAQHTRLIFNIASLSSDGDKVVSFSLDRTVVIWDIKARKGVCSFSSFGGYVYCARASPLEPGCVAIGAGDNMIRVWNQGKRTNPFDISTHYYGMKSKITTVSWHPQREGLLAYGTEDGRVGVYNLLSSKYPSMSGTFHNKIVYVVCWAPPLEAGKGGHDFEVYSVGDGIILQHYIGDGETKRDAVNLVKAIQAVNGEEKEKINRSEISWHSDFTMFAVGCDNGSVTVYSFPRLQRICSVSLHQKLVNCIRWHPQTTGESPHLSPCHSLVAFAGNDSCVTVVDLSQVFLGTASGSSSPLREVQAYRQLQGHHQRTTDLCWSPHHDGRMVTVGYDNVAVVWDVRTSAVLACYNQHPGRLLTVLWSNLDPDLIMTGGFDSTFRMWKVSEQPKEVTSADRKKKKKKAPPKVPEAVSEDKSISSAAELASEQEMEELMDLLKQKRQLLMSELHLDKDKDVTNNASESRGSVPAPNAVANTAAPRSGDITPGAASVTAANDRKTLPRSAAEDFRLERNGGQRHLVAYGDVDDFLVEDPAEPSPVLSASSSSLSGGRGRVGGQHSAAHSSPTRPVAVPTRAAAAAAAKNRRADIGVAADRGGGDVAHHLGSCSGDEEGTELLADRAAPSVAEIVAPVKPLFPRARAAARGSGGGLAGSAASSSAVSSESVSVTGDKARRRKVKPKTLFPVWAAAANRGKAGLHEDVLDIARIISGQGDPDLVDRKPHLGIYTDRLGAHRCLLQESEYHLSHENMDYHLQLELWRGNVAGAVQIARQRNELSDWIVAMAPQASLELWQEVSGEYAEQLEEDGQYHKAATYLLAAQKVRQTIDLFRRHRLFKEAVSLAKVRLSPMDPVLEDLYMEWGQVLMKDGQIEQAAKCYLAMRQVQEAGMVLTRRQDHASLKTACHMTLIANEQHPQGMLYAFRLFSQYLASGDWSEAHAFIAEHETLKVLLPLLCTHELLVQQLASLCPELTLTQKSSTSNHFFLKEKKEPATGKVGPPEFLLDKSERDPVVPWEAHLIGEHSFPHHVLRAWYRGLDIARLLQELNATYMAIVQMAPPQQGAPDTPTVLVQVSVELTLCLLSLLTAETTSAVLHLLHSLAALHQGGHLKLLQAICRLMLPQGPKYMLKLQQEFNASRVLIAMENNGNVDQAGVEGHNTIKKYLTDVKEDGHISTASPRCRELDCVRAYFYLVVLDYLREDLNLSHSDNDSLDGMPNGPLSGEASSGSSEGGAVSDIGKESGSLTSSEGGATKEKSVLSSSPKSGDSSPGAGGEVKDDVKSAPCAASPGVAGKKSDSSSSTRPKLKCDSQEGVATSGEKVGEKTTSSSLSKSGSKDKEDSDRSHQLGSLSSPTAPKSSSVDPPSVLLPPLATKAVKGSSRSPPSPLSSSSPLSPHAAPKASSTSVLSSSPTSAAAAAAMPPRSPGSLHGGDPLSVIKGNSPVSENSSKLSATAASSSPSSLSPPLLSLSPNTSSTGTASATSPSVTTRGQISFRNLLRLSKGILWDVQAKREALTETLGYIHRAISQHLLTNRTSVSSEEGPESESSGSSSRKDGGAHGEEDGGSHRPQLSSVPAAATSPVLSGTPDILKGAHVGATGQPGSVTPPSTTTPTSLSPRLEFGGYRGPIRSLSEPMAHSNTPTSPLEGKMESNVIGFQVEKELLGSFTDYLSSSQKSRKILWMDNRGSPEDIDSGPLSPSGSMARDAGRVPVDWDELPVDVKYFQPYVSLTMLKQEQEALSQELKRVPDTSKAPFPSSRASIKKLMEVCLHSPLLSPQERAVYHKQLSDWAVLFSVTSQQKLETDEFFSAVVAKLGSSS